MIDAGESVVGSYSSSSRSSPWSDEGGGVRINGALQLLRPMVTGCVVIGSGRDKALREGGTVGSRLTGVAGADFAREGWEIGVLQSLYRARKDRSWVGERCADVAAGKAGTESD